MPVPTIFVSGTVGSDKSTVAAEISDLCIAIEIPHAAVDLDKLRWQWPHTSEFNIDLMSRTFRRSG